MADLTATQEAAFDTARRFIAVTNDMPWHDSSNVYVTAHGMSGSGYSPTDLSLTDVRLSMLVLITLLNPPESTNLPLTNQGISDKVKEEANSQLDFSRFKRTAHPIVAMPKPLNFEQAFKAQLEVNREQSRVIANLVALLKEKSDGQKL